MLWAWHRKEGGAFKPPHGNIIGERLGRLVGLVRASHSNLAALLTCCTLLPHTSLSPINFFEAIYNSAPPTQSLRLAHYDLSSTRRSPAPAIRELRRYSRGAVLVRQQLWRHWSRSSSVRGSLGRRYGSTAEAEWEWSQWCWMESRYLLWRV